MKYFEKLNMCFKKKKMVLSIYLVSEGHGSPKSKKQHVTGRISEELNSGNEKILRFKERK